MPVDLLLRQVDAVVNYEKLYKMVELLYSKGEGRYSINLVMWHLNGNASLRGTLRREQTDVAYHRFLEIHAELGAAPPLHGELQLPVGRFPTG